MHANNELSSFADSLKESIPAITKAFEEFSQSIANMSFPEVEAKESISPVKIRRAKLRKKKRKHGGPR